MIFEVKRCSLKIDVKSFHSLLQTEKIFNTIV